MTREIHIGHIGVGGKNPLVLIAGPCVIESEETTYYAAEKLKEICSRLELPFIFKSSYDKANRTSLTSFRGPGLAKGLKVLAGIRQKYNIPVISDIHASEDIGPASEVLDALQIPALLCRQTDLIVAAAKSGKALNVKKGQFLAPWDVQNIIDKAVSSGNRNICITERGTSFGYNNLVVDFTGLPIMRSFGYPVVFDVTHSIQSPGGKGSCSGGKREFAGPLARAAAAVGVDGIFMEVHPEPDKALCDGPNMVALDELPHLLTAITAIDKLLK